MAGAQGSAEERSWQLTPHIDAGASRVHYDGFLPSGLVSLSPSIRFDGPNAVLLARASLGRFDSGNLNGQVLLAGGWFTHARGMMRGELATQLAVGGHQSIGGSGTAQVTARLHAASRTQGAWAGVGGGWSSIEGGIGGGARSADVGGWLRRGALRVSGSVQPNAVGELRFVDVEGAVRWTRGRVELGGEAGWRGGDVTESDGAGRTTWALADAILWATPRVGVTVAAGRFLADPGSSTIGGRYATLGMRFAPARAPRDELPRVLLPRVPTVPDAANDGAEAEGLAISETADGRVVLRFTLPDARVAEIMGDFTDWQPVELRRVGQGVWELQLRLDAGVHRINLRTDGGEWRVPPDLTVVSDGYGGRVGLLVVRR